MSLGFLLQLVALVCLICAAVGVPSSRFGLGWTGMALWLLSTMLSGVVLRG